MPVAPVSLSSGAPNGRAIADRYGSGGCCGRRRGCDRGLDRCFMEIRIVTYTSLVTFSNFNSVPAPAQRRPPSGWQQPSPASPASPACSTPPPKLPSLLQQPSAIVHLLPWPPSTTTSHRVLPSRGLRSGRALDAHSDALGTTGCLSCCRRTRPLLILIADRAQCNAMTTILSRRSPFPPLPAPGQSGTASGDVGDKTLW